MAITKEQVEYVANLARLTLSAEETLEYQQGLNDILDFMEKLNELDTDQVEPLIHVLGSGNVLRKDELDISLDEDDVLANAPDRIDNYFRVPKIL